MIPDQSLERVIKASERTGQQLKTIKELEDSIDDKARAVIRQTVVKEIDEAVKQLKQTNPNIDPDNPANNNIPSSKRTETWINGYQNILAYRFQALTTEESFLKERAIEGGPSKAYLPAPVFIEMISDLKADILKGEMDQMIHSRTASIIYTRMKELEATYIPEWKKQTKPKYQLPRHSTHRAKDGKMVPLGRL